MSFSAPRLASNVRTRITAARSLLPTVSSPSSSSAASAARLISSRWFLNPSDGRNFASNVLAGRSSSYLLSQHPTPSHRHSLGSYSVRFQHGAAAVGEADVSESFSGGAAIPDKITEFSQLAQYSVIDPRIIRTVTTKMGLKTLTDVQTETIRQGVTGRDVLAQAKTGTGKTMAFLLPVIQRILQASPELASKSRSESGFRSRDGGYGRKAGNVRAIVISPTRELAEQIAVEAAKVCQDTGIKVQIAVGGTRKGDNLRQMRLQGCDILVATPGRLKDVLSDQSSGVGAPNLEALVLDEADRLMDQGFWPEIQEIMQLLPSAEQKDRQTLMFSATMPRDVVELVYSTMKKDLHYFASVKANESPVHERVKTHLVVTPGLENMLPTLLELCDREMNAYHNSTASKPFKAIVFFPSVAETALAYDLFRGIKFDRNSSFKSLNGTYVDCIHSKLTQAQRTRAAANFRRNDRAILMSSDVTARGMDFPNVTHVIQMGLPQTEDFYIHRLGRTARAGEEGEGWLLLPSGELSQAHTRLPGLVPKEDFSLQSAKVKHRSDGGDPEGMTPEIQQYWDLFRDVIASGNLPDPESLRKVYLAILGTHQYMNKTQLIEMMNQLTKIQWGMDVPPQVPSGLAQQLNLTRVPGVNLGHGSNRFDGGRDPRGRDSRSSRGSQRFPSAEELFGNNSSRGGWNRGGRDFQSRRSF